MRSFATNQTCFTFDQTVPLEDVEGTLELSRLAAGILHGMERVELEAPCTLDRGARTVTITTATDAGRTLATIFLGYVRREFGGKSVLVQPEPTQIAGAA